MAGGIQTLKIVYLHQYFSTPKMNLGGIRSYEMAKRLVAWGHEVHVVTSDTSGAATNEQNTDWVETDENGVHVHWLPVPYHNSMGFAQRVKAFLRFAAAAARKAASIDGDLVFATSTPLTIALPGVWAAKRRKRPMVFEVRDLWPEIPIAIGALKSKPVIMAAQWLERFSYRNSAAVIALSPGMRDGVTKVGYPDNRITIIPNAADLDLFDVPEDAGRAFRQRYPWLQDRPMVLYGGTFGFMNGVSYLPKLAAEVMPINPDIRFVAIGSGAEKDQVRKTASELGVLDKNFFIIERVNKEEMPAIHKAADVVTSLFIDLPEMRANSANKFFDGLASGTPVAINYGGWHADLLREANAGLLLDPRDLAGSAKSLAGHLEDRSWLEQAGKNARELAKSQFARDDLARRLEGVLTDVLEREAA
ncbi:MAG: glycosyltransferase family 4 protein [Pseudomonadota bacterium]